MKLPFTLSAYISCQFMAASLNMLLALSCLVAMFDFIELLRRSVSKADATFGLVSQIAALRLPYVMIQILPFAILLGGILAFWRLTRSSELIVVRAAGTAVALAATHAFPAFALTAAFLAVVAMHALADLDRLLVTVLTALLRARRERKYGPHGGQSGRQRQSRQFHIVTPPGKTPKSTPGTRRRQ